MNSKKGQINGAGILIVVALAVIVGAILLQATAQNVGDVTNTITITNESFAAANNTLYTFSYKALTGVVIYNNTGDFLITSGNYTVTNNVITDGALTATVAVNYSGAAYAGDGWNISGTAQPTTYADGASRAVTGLIIVFFALAIAAIGLYPIYQGELRSILAGTTK